MKLRNDNRENWENYSIVFWKRPDKRRRVIAGREKLLAIKRMKRCSLIPKTKIKMETVEV
ncbi:hypothetical protein EBR03_04950 [bacterium]|nr:hypothetical protein [bacterium]